MPPVVIVLVALFGIGCFALAFLCLVAQTLDDDREFELSLEDRVWLDLNVRASWDWDEAPR